MPVGEPYSNGAQGNGLEHVSERGIWANGDRDVDISQMQSIVLRTFIAPQVIARNRIFLGHAAGQRSQREGLLVVSVPGILFSGR